MFTSLSGKLLNKVRNVISDLTSTLKEVQKNEDGVTAVEYALILAGIAIVALVALTPLGNAIKNIFTDALNAL